MDSQRHSPDSQNDSDDWTLVSPQRSPSSSPERLEFLLNRSRSTQTNQSSSNSSLEQIIEDDGLTEVELNDYGGEQKVSLDTTNAKAYQACEEAGGSSSTEPTVPGFQAIDTTTDEEVSETTGSRRSSLTQSELNEYVDFGKKMEDSDTVTDKSFIGNDVEADSTGCEQQQGESMMTTTIMSTSQNQAKDEQSDRPRSQKLLDNLTSDLGKFYNSNGVIMVIVWTIVFLVTLLYRSYIVLDSHSDNLSRNRYFEGALNSFKKANRIPSSQYVELQLLNDELSQCIKRQSPSSFKYYMSEERLKDLGQKRYGSRKANKHSFGTMKSYRGLFCYGQEMQWRKRFDRLKSEHNLDLRRLMEEAKKHVTTEMFESLHPSLEFKLILNQLEYLDFLEARRNKKESEETIKHLKAENLQLLGRLNQPNRTNFQKLVMVTQRLELENSKLRQENWSLKSKFTEKSGSVNVKQSEEVENENVKFRIFLKQIAREISKNLKLFNLHIVDALGAPDDQGSLNAQLMLTSGYMRRLNEKISSVLIENKGLREELKEVYLSLSTTNDHNLPATQSSEMHDHHVVDARDKNESNALIADSCMRNLHELREKSAHLENEVDRLKKECSKTYDIERTSERQLNRTDEVNNQSSDEQKLISKNWRRIGSHLDTGLDRRIKDMLSMRNDDTFFDELMLFLTKFNSQIESNELTKIHRTLDHIDHQEENDEFLFNNEITKQQHGFGDKIIPNYIREAIRDGGLTNFEERVRSDKVSLSLDRQGNDLLSNVNHQVKPPPPSPLRDNFHWGRPLNISVQNINRLFSQQKVGDDVIPKHQQQQQYNDEKGQTNQQKLHVKTQNESVESAPVYNRQSYSASSDLGSSTVSEEDLYAAAEANVARDTWFFKRAKQRKQLRRNNPKVDMQTTHWLMKRAKLREKLRRASSYIEYHYLSDYMFTNGDDKPLYSSNNRNRHQNKQKQHENGKKHKNKQQQKHKNYNKYFRDEL